MDSLPPVQFTASTFCLLADIRTFEDNSVGNVVLIGSIGVAANHMAHPTYHAVHQTSTQSRACIFPTRARVERVLYNMTTKLWSTMG